jgi:hypothetical protein
MKTIKWLEPITSISLPMEMFQDIDEEMIKSAENESLEVQKQYVFYFDIVKRFNSQSILEIGVRNGYSMYMMMLANPNVFYRGIEIDMNFDGGFKGAYKHANVLIDKYFPEVDANIFIYDSQKIRSLPRNFDLAHVDGSHSFEGALSDIELVAPIANKIIIDDYTLCSTVADAIESFIDKYDKRYDLKPEYYKTWRGHVILDTSNFLNELL